MVTHDKNSSRSTAGHAIFSQVAIPRLGRHLLTFSVHEWAPLDGETDAQVRITTATAHNYFDIVAGEAAKLAVLSQPPEGSIAGVFGDEAADLYPFPRVGLADAFLNLITKSSPETTGVAMVVLCVEGTDTRAPVPASACLCDDDACLQPLAESQDAVRNYSLRFLEGEVQADFVAGAATFDSLRVKMARSDMKLMFMQIIAGIPAGFKAFSNSFLVTPGRVKALRFLRDPGSTAPAVASCPRCPAGVHLAGETLPVHVELLDAFQNRVAFCFEGRACAHQPEVTLAAQLITSAEDVQDAILTGQLTDSSDAGFLAFHDLHVERAASGYVLRLCIVDDLVEHVIVSSDSANASVASHQRLCSDGGNHFKVHADSMPFTVTPGKPANMSVLRMSSNAGELQLLPIQPVTQVEDRFGNTVDSDCWRQQCSTSNQMCNATELCLLHLDVSLHKNDGSPILPGSGGAVITGQNLVVVSGGVGSFTDLAIVADTSEWPDPITKCTCRDGYCGSCSAQDDSECMLPHPFPDYTLRFQTLEDAASDALPLATVDAEIQLQNRAQRMNIVVQPALIVAREVFASNIVVEILDCKGDVALYDSAAVSVSIPTEFNAGGGTLSGKTESQVQNGMAVFTDLGIDLFGNGFKLRFEYAGVSPVAHVDSMPFRVEKPVEALVQIELESFGETVTAGEPLKAQPVVVLRGRDGETLANTVLPVTASISPFGDPGSWQDWDFCQDHFKCDASSGKSVSCGGPFSAADPTAACKCVVGGQTEASSMAGAGAQATCPSTLLGQLVVIPVEGTARFENLAFTKASVGQHLEDVYPNAPLTYQMSISLGKVQITTPSGVLHVRPAEWAAIMISPSRQPSQTNLAGQPLSRQPLIILVDRFKNRVLGSQIPPNTFVGVSIKSGPPGAPIVRRGCYGRGQFSRDILGQPLVKDYGQDCYGTRPVTCRDCPDVNISANSRVGGYVGEASYTDLELVKEGKYILAFHCRSYVVVSHEFSVINTDPSYPFVLQSIPQVNSADRVFEQQPMLTVKDQYGNFVKVDSIPKRTISVTLVGPTPIPPRRIEGPPVRIVQENLATGQKPGAICRAAPRLFEGRKIVSIDADTGIGVFTDLALRQVYDFYRFQFTILSSKGDLVLNSSTVRVVAGDTVGLCPLQLPADCGARAPCFTAMEIGCVDSYGNVQARCDAKRGTRILSPTEIPPGYTLDCSTGMCLRLITGPDQAFASSKTLSNGQSCSHLRCQAELRQGIARFTDIQLSLTGTDYSLAVFAYIIDPYTNRIEKWEYVTPRFDVYPPAPMVTKVEFTQSMNQLMVYFDRPTNMNEGVRKPRDKAYVAAKGWDPYLLVGPCEQEVSEAFLASLGDGPFCTWQNTTVFRIALGGGATVSASTQFHLSEKSKIVYSSFEGSKRLDSLPALTRVGVNVAGSSLSFPPHLSPCMRASREILYDITFE